MPLIQCGDHSYAPAVIVCTHLYEGHADSWCPVPSCDPEVDYDWLCPICIERFPHVDVDDLVAVCMHCARKLKRRSSKRKH
jgi:hypothetical protein